MNARICLVVMLALVAVKAPALDVAALGMEELVLHASCYGSTAAKRENRSSARDELKSRGDAALRYLMGQMHVTNMWISILTVDLVRQDLPREQAASVLLEFLADEQVRTRKMAAYFLGFCDTPQHAARLRPLLDDEQAGGAAARTLGKWRDADAVDAIIPMLQAEKEGRRIVAANALRDIGDARAIVPLIAALDDSVFTVRKVAARTLGALGAPAEKRMIKALVGSSRTARREIIAVLGRSKTRRARRALKRMRNDSDEAIARDVRAALAEIGIGD